MKKKLVYALLGLVVVLTVGATVGCTVREKVKAESNSKITSEGKDSKEEKKVAKLLDVEGEDEVEVEVETEEKETSEKPEKEKAETTKKEESKKEDTKKEETKKEDTKKDTSTSKKDEPKKETGTTDKKEDTKKEEKHTHDWVAVYKEVDNGHYEKVLVKEAWTEEIVKQKKVGAEICKGCGHAMFTEDEVIEHGESAAISGRYECGSRYSGYVLQDYTITVNHPAEYKDVWVPKIEKELTGYKCSCGATK